MLLPPGHPGKAVEEVTETLLIVGIDNDRVIVVPRASQQDCLTGWPQMQAEIHVRKGTRVNEYDAAVRCPPRRRI